MIATNQASRDAHCPARAVAVSQPNNRSILPFGQFWPSSIYGAKRGQKDGARWYRDPSGGLDSEDESVFRNNGSIYYFNACPHSPRIPPEGFLMP